MGWLGAGTIGADWPGTVPGAGAGVDGGADFAGAEDWVCSRIDPVLLA